MTYELKALLETLEQGGNYTQEQLELIAAANRALDVLLDTDQGDVMTRPMQDAAFILSGALVRGGWRAQS